MPVTLVSLILSLLTSFMFSQVLFLCVVCYKNSFVIIFFNCVGGERLKGKAQHKGVARSAVDVQLFIYFNYDLSSTTSWLGFHLL